MYIKLAGKVVHALKGATTHSPLHTGVLSLSMTIVLGFLNHSNVEKNWSLNEVKFHKWQKQKQIILVLLSL